MCYLELLKLHIACFCVPDVVSCVSEVQSQICIPTHLTYMCFVKQLCLCFFEMPLYLAGKLTRLMMVPGARSQTLENFTWSRVHNWLTEASLCPGVERLTGCCMLGHVLHPACHALMHRALNGAIFMLNFHTTGNIIITRWILSKLQCLTFN